MIAVVFSAMTLEAFINEYGETRISGSTFKNNFESMSLIQKILLIPLYDDGTKLETTNNIYAKLKGLIDLRNNLVHYKFKKHNIDNIKKSIGIQKSIITAKHAHLALETVKEVIEYFDPKKLIIYPRL